MPKASVMTAQNVLFDWSIDPVVVAGLLLAALLYARGVRYARAHGLARHWHSGQAVAFFAAGLRHRRVGVARALGAYGPA